MEIDEFKTILANLLVRASITAPLKSQIQISVSRYRKTVSLSIPIFAPFGPMPQSIVQYVAKRQGVFFKPHKSRFEDIDGKIHLIQEIPFHLSGQTSLRGEVAHFWNLALRCHKMLKEIALEEKAPKFASLDFSEEL